MSVQNTDAWMSFMRAHLGQHEVGNNRGPVVAEMIRLGKCGKLGDPWCAITVCAALEQAGIRSPRSASSQAIRYDKNFVQVDKPIYGSIAVFWRNSPKAGVGHIGFASGLTLDKVKVLGGNEDDAIRDQWYAKQKPGWGLVGFYMPRGVPMVANRSLETGNVASGGTGKVV